MRSILLLPTLIWSSIIFAQRFETIAYGYWNNPAVWQNGQVPSTVFNDSVFIHHPIAFTANMEINGFMKIDSSGAICGHNHLLVRGMLKVNGYFEVDSLKVDGGLVKILGPGHNVATFQTQVTNGGSLSLTGGSLAVGPWFDCRDSDFFFLSGINSLENEIVKLFPNPTTNFINLEGNLAEVEFVLCDVSGKVVLSGKAKSIIDLSNLKNGIYFIHLSKLDKNVVWKKIVKA